jgi:hypothetical protein
MAGINRLYSLQKFENRSTFLATGVKCVFLSHQKADGKEAKKIADYLLSLDIDVYFDEYDKELISHHQ